MRELLVRTFEVDAPRAQAWDHVARIEAWPSWARHIRSIEMSGPLGPDATGLIRLRNGIRSRFRVTEFEAGNCWTWEGPFLWIRIRYDHEFDAVDATRTRITFRVLGEGAALGTLGRLFAAIYARNLDRAIVNLSDELRATT